MEDNLRRIRDLLKVGDADQARKEAEMLIKEDPKDASGYFCLSHVYFYGFSDKNNASKYLEEALKLDRLNEQEPAVVSTTKLSPEEIEPPLLSTEAVLEKQLTEEVAAAEQPQLSLKEHKKIQSDSKDESPWYKKWQIYMAITLSIILVYRAGKLYNVYHKSNENTMPNISQEEKKVITESADKILKIKQKNFNVHTAVLKLYGLKISDFSENSLREYVSDQYVPIVMEKAGQPSVENLKNSHPAKFYEEETSMYLSVKSDDSTFILEIAGDRINHIYGETWDNSEQEMQRYHELLNKLETQGVEAKGKKD
ncbi:hypothetical protein ACEOWJ_001703 [Bacillus cereus]|uniref:tetratricopeptide repeat protein n=2 Tax=Bacillaceae TaxID=186817 RepID=UPI0009DEAE72|nr:hypothetical protein [Bacillus sp. 491mf]